jgi:hypothetical protein
VTTLRSVAPDHLERDLVADIFLHQLQLGYHVEVVGQRKARGSGTTEGATDVLLSCCGWYVPVELKKDARAEVRKCQVLQAKMRREQNVDTAGVWSFAQFVDVVNYCRKHGRPLVGMPHPLVGKGG